MGTRDEPQGVPHFRRRNRPVKLYVGNLSYDTTEYDLLDAFAPLGARKASLNFNTTTLLSCGYGFIEFDEKEKASLALSIMDGAELGGRPLRVNPAKDKPRKKRIISKEK